ncbi:putative 1,3-beta-glucan synthase [Helianthus annuus]|nr:putative 1,3-beta-glucan synthase [Helianthus annuus]
MTHRHRPPPSPEPHPTTTTTTYNIIPIHNLLADHPSLRFPEVRAATAALRAVGDLRRPPFIPWQPHYDLLDWLGAFFGFQSHNVSNQREHLVLHLSNAQMRLQPPPDIIDTLDHTVLRKFRRKLLSNYTRWCSFIGCKSNIWISDSRRQISDADSRRELLYVALYLLIWGESANLRFMPECICYIFHHMAMELNRILEDYIDENTGRPVLPSISGENAFLERVVKPIYDTVKLEVEFSRNGTAPHANWRNYDDMFYTRMWSQRNNDGRWTSAANKRVLTKSKKDVNKVINILQALYEVVIRDFFREKRTMNELKEDGLAPHRPLSGAGLLFENAVELPGSENENFYRQTRRLHTILTSRDSMNNIPVNIEARRRIAFFSNSLFMNIPHAPQVEKMMAFSVLTPYYNEEVVYSKEQLRTENEDGISVLYYLQTIYADEWVNFLQRMKREGMVSEDELWMDKSRDLRLWASYRGQTLARTVRGMMYYYRALKMLAFLDSASEMDIREGARELVPLGSISSADGSIRSGRSLQRADSTMSTMFKGHEYGTALMKYTYVVACQIYGTQKAKKDPHAEEILYLMKNNEALRVAYVDEVAKRDGTDYYSVLVKYDQELEKEVEVYRVKLPGPLKLGEGKPENQNHALIFTRGDAVQTIDMNQDNYFEEALKMRNLLEEYKMKYGLRKPNILGVRENIFTGSVSSLAWFMSAQETSFVTLGQRVLANPLKIRLHYGHPDVFDRFWFLTRGGLSKASRLINLSEDIFAGFNCTLRGGNVTHHEYIQVGKGRDVGLNQVSMFEAKVASGNGEQVLSRDVYRLGHRLDFFRMLSFFYTTVGFFFNTMMISLTVYAFLWGRLYLALSGVENSVTGDASTNRALGTILNQQFIVQLGIFTALPMIVENTLELGFLSAIWDFITMQLQLSSVFYTFSLGTRSHYFGRTILHGGAKYRATGRGFVVEHKKFAENYRLYARSHFIKAIELGLILTVYAGYSPVAKGTFTYIALTISSWFLVFSWIMAPFVFNPSGFDWLKTVYDYDDFMNWIGFRGGVFAKSEESWERWWYEEQDHLRNTGLFGKIFEIILDLRFFFFQYGIVYQLGIAAGSKSFAVYILSWIYVIVALVLYTVVVYARDKYSAREHIYYRLVQFLVVALGILILIALLEFTQFKFLDIFTSLLAFLPTGWGFLLIAQVFRPVLEKTIFWGTVVSVARTYDAMFGVIVLTPVAVLSWMPGFQSMQTRILFNEAFSRGLRIFQIIVGKKSKA